MLESILFVSIVVSISAAQDPTVRTKYGEVIGVNVQLDTGKNINSFYGIPFAKPPVGNLRFRPPEEPGSWTTAREAKEIGPVCPQDAEGLLQLTHAGFGLIPGYGTFSEDCLHLNIHAPATGGQYPVMFWIHGGGYTGSANIQYPGHFLAGNDVVVVVTNYRLGHLGFMSTDDEASPGNYGLMDQIQALKFVRDNIEAFGGNPNKVTIFGQSAGGSSSGLLSLIPQAKGLFHQMIMESGTDLAIWAVNGREQKPETYTRRVAEQLNCPTDNNGDMMNCLRGKDPDELRHTEFNCTLGHFCQGFGPVIDGNFIPDHPQYLREEGRFEPIPILNGITSEDGSLYTIALVPESWDGNITRDAFHQYLRRLVDYFAVRFPDRGEDVFRALDFMYSPWPHVEDQEENRQAFNTLITDVAFGSSADVFMKTLSNKGADIYSYVLAFRSAKAASLVPEWMGVPHNGELPYVWGFPLLQLNEDVRDQQSMSIDLIEWDQEDIEFTRFIQTLWTNFAKYGNPTPQPVKLPFSEDELDWPKFNATTNDLKYAWLDRQTEVTENYRQKNHAFWNNYMAYLVPEVFNPERPEIHVTTAQPPSRCTCPPTVESGKEKCHGSSLVITVCFLLLRILLL